MWSALALSSFESCGSNSRDLRAGRVAQATARLRHGGRMRSHRFRKRRNQSKHARSDSEAVDYAIQNEKAASNVSPTRAKST